MEILEKEKTDNYVKLIITELEVSFKSLHQIDKIDGKWEDEYTKFKLDFCESISCTFEFVNKLFAHIESGQETYLKSLDVFDNAVDPYATIFYNAIVGKKQM